MAIAKEETLSACWSMIAKGENLSKLRIAFCHVTGYVRITYRLPSHTIFHLLDELRDDLEPTTKQSPRHPCSCRIPFHAAFSGFWLIPAHSRDISWHFTGRVLKCVGAESHAASNVPFHHIPIQLRCPSGNHAGILYHHYFPKCSRCNWLHACSPDTRISKWVCVLKQKSHTFYQCPGCVWLLDSITVVPKDDSFIFRNSCLFEKLRDSDSGDG